MKNVLFKNPFAKPTPSDIAKTKLEEFKRQLLLQEDRAHYHLKMVEYCKARIKELSNHAG